MRYKNFQNIITNNISWYRIQQNGDIIAKAKREIMESDKMKSKTPEKNFKKGKEEISDEKKIVEIFNKFLIQKIEVLKENRCKRSKNLKIILKSVT